MKKILFSVVCLMMVGMQSVKAQVAIAALHHNNAVTIYAAAQIQDAIDVSEPGDTLYLSEGIFGGFTVAKPIAIIGAGQTTQISSDVTIGNIGGTLETGLLLSGANLLQDLNFKYTIDGARIMQCMVDGNCDFPSSNGTDNISNIEILMSYIKGYLDLSAKTQGITVVGSKIGQVRGGTTGEGGSTFLNCSIGQTYNSGVIANNNNYVNCVVGTIYRGVFSNCLYSNLLGNYGAVIHECYQDDFTMPDNLDSPYTDEELRTKGYLGTDNTVVGITGGQAPFSLVMPVVQVTEHSLEVNQAERKLRVSLKLGNK